MNITIEKSVRRALALPIIVGLLGSLGCSTSKIAVGAMVPILENSKTAALASNDIRTFNEATPSNLFLLEGLIATDPKNRRLRESAAMLYFSYAFTLDAREDESYASLLYQKGLGHGKNVLFRNKRVAEAWDKPFEEFSASMSQLGDKDLPALVWTVANWSQFISLHLDSTEVLVDIPRVQVLLERACDIDGEYFEGLPYMILGSLHAFRPPLMGGDPEASRENFDRAIAMSDGKFLLAHYFFAKFYCYRIQDADMFEKTLLHVIGQPDTVLPDYRLLNAIAIDKSAVLLKEKDELF
ncbi:MAG: TRAP transporter TatT component family protein [Candidatus Krumholzibacteria bacterium]|nr:TRAP transporter TatT component family protein [Candidatus Krumholzibacteria bacterium]